MNLNKVIAAAKNRVLEVYQQELDKHRCDIHDHTATISLTQSGFEIQACCQDQHDFVTSFLKSRVQKDEPNDEDFECET